MHSKSYTDGATSVRSNQMIEARINKKSWDAA